MGGSWSTRATYFRFEGDIARPNSSIISMILRMPPTICAICVSKGMISGETNQLDERVHARDMLAKQEGGHTFVNTILLSLISTTRDPSSEQTHL